MTPRPGLLDTRLQSATHTCPRALCALDLSLLDTRPLSKTHVLCLLYTRVLDACLTCSSWGFLRFRVWPTWSHRAPATLGRSSPADLRERERERERDYITCRLHISTDTHISTETHTCSGHCSPFNDTHHITCRLNLSTESAR